jgi:2-phospho-L-lactate transferase/gluconeogenesis factor (CofD/UPF0052 family)
MNLLILNMRGIDTLSTLEYAAEKIGMSFHNIDLHLLRSDLDKHLTYIVQEAKSGKKVVLSLDLMSMEITESLSNSMAYALSNRRMAGVDISDIDSVAIMVPAGYDASHQHLQPLLNVCSVFDIKSTIKPMEDAKTHLFSESGIGNILLARHVLGHIEIESKTAKVEPRDYLHYPEIRG